MLGPWTCSRCGKVNEDGNLCECGLGRARVIYNELLTKRLFVETGKSGHTNYEILQKFAWGYASRRNMPSYLVEDAFGKAMERIVENIGKYDVNGASFLTWSMSFVKNELRSAARNDIRKWERIEISVDEEMPDGELVVEAIEGDSFGLDDLVEIEESQREREAKRRIASSLLGEVREYVKGKLTEVPVYFKALEIFYELDGDESEWGWISELAHRTGMNRQTIHARIDKASGVWDRVKDEVLRI